MKFLPRAVKSELRVVRYLIKKLYFTKKSLHEVQGNFHVPCNGTYGKVHGNFHVPFQWYCEKYMEISMCQCIRAAQRNMEISVHLHCCIKVHGRDLMRTYYCEVPFLIYCLIYDSVYS